MPIELKDIRSGYNLAEINNNFKTIERTWDEKLDRLTSLQGNQMSVDLDMNGKAILNVKASTDKNSLVNKEYVDDANEIQDERLEVLEESFDVGSGTSSVSWTYIAVGGETSVSPPFHFNNVRELHINGLLKTEQLDWSWAESQGQQINIATALSASDVVVVRVGGESTDLIPPDVDLEDLYGVPVFELRVGMTISPVNNQYPKLKAFNAIYELADNSASYTVKSFTQSVGGDCVITLSDDSLLIAKKADAASRYFVQQSDNDVKSWSNVYFGVDDVNSDKSLRLSKNQIIGKDAFPNQSAKRDAYQVLRSIENYSDCHAFADRTVLKNISDYGGYGTFDAVTTVTVKSNQTLDHTFAYQARNKFQGTDTTSKLKNLYGGICWLETYGRGTVEKIRGWQLKTVGGDNLAAINNYIGIEVQNQNTTYLSASFSSAQSYSTTLPHYSYYSTGSAPSYFSGGIGIGHIDTVADVNGRNYPLSLRSNSSINHMRFGIDDGNGCFIQSKDDAPISFFANGTNLNGWRIANIQGLNSFVPMQNNYSNIGSPSFNIRQIFTQQPALSTSDRNYKTEIQDIPQQVINAWKRVKPKMYKMTDAIAEKGTNARWHFGVIAQDIVEAFKAEGLNAFDYGIVGLDRWDDIYENVLVNAGETVESVNDEDQIVYEPAPPIFKKVLVKKSGEKYCVRYSEIEILNMVAQLSK